MFDGLTKALTKRSWYVPNVNIWGTKGWSDFDLLLLEDVGSDDNISFMQVNLGEGTQEINYNQLTDFRGNKLPETIKNPKVFIKPKSETTCFIVGEETERKFKIARSSDASGSVLADLYILEMN